MNGFLSIRKQASRESFARVTSGRHIGKAILFVSSCLIIPVMMTGFFSWTDFYFYFSVTLFISYGTSHINVSCCQITFTDIRVEGSLAAWDLLPVIP